MAAVVQRNKWLTDDRFLKVEKSLWILVYNADISHRKKYEINYI